MCGVFIDAKSILDIKDLETVLLIISIKFDKKPQFLHVYDCGNLALSLQIKSFCSNNGITYNKSDISIRNSSSIDLMFDIYEYIDKLTTVVIVGDDKIFTKISKVVLSKNKQCINIRHKACDFEQEYSRTIYLDNLIFRNSYVDEEIIHNVEFYNKNIEVLSQSINSIKEDSLKNIEKFKKYFLSMIEVISNIQKQNEQKINSLEGSFDVLKEDLDMILSFISGLQTKDNKTSINVEEAIVNKQEHEKEPTSEDVDTISSSNEQEHKEEPANEDVDTISLSDEQEEIEFEVLNDKILETAEFAVDIEETSDFEINDELVEKEDYYL